MFRKQVDPKIAAVATVITLGIIQSTYWRLLVHRSPLIPGGAGEIAGPPRFPPPAIGLKRVFVETLTGDEPGYVDGPSWSARFAGPNALALDADGSLLVADSRNHCIRRVSARGQVSTVAGGDVQGIGGDDLGPVARARFRFPSGVAVSKSGAIIVADAGNHRLCRLVNGQVSFVAGGTPGDVDGVGTSARFRSPSQLAYDSRGRLWLVDLGNEKLRLIEFQPSGIGAVTTPKTIPAEILSTLGNLFHKKTERVASANEGTAPIRPTAHRTGALSTAAKFPSGLRIYGDLNQHVIYMQRPGSGPVLLAGMLQWKLPLISGESGPGNRSRFASPVAFVAKPNGTVYIADYDGNRIRKIRMSQAMVQ